MSDPDPPTPVPDHLLQAPTPEILVMAYAQGAFPMSDPESGQMDWFSPDPRAILPLESLHVPKSVARVLRAASFDVRFDRDFEAVMRACAAPREAGDGHEGDTDGTWIDERLVTAYVELHRLGLAHSIEAWRDDQLVGGLYGVHLGGAFFGESMFVRPELGGRDSSKVCLVRLVEHLRDIGATLLDTQFSTPHLARFGVTEIPRADYLTRLESALTVTANWSDGPEPREGHRQRDLRAPNASREPHGKG